MHIMYSDSCQSRPSNDTWPNTASGIDRAGLLAQNQIRRGMRQGRGTLCGKWRYLGISRCARDEGFDRGEGGHGC